MSEEVSRLSPLTFPNGFRVIYQPSKQNVPLTSFSLFCNIGSAYETDSERGMSHFIEHMIFKGTDHFTSGELFKEYDKMGAYFNAFTTKRYTCYEVKCDTKYVDPCVMLLSDMLFHSTFEKELIQIERDIIQEENWRDQGDPRKVSYQQFASECYKSSSFEFPIDHFHPNKPALSQDTLINGYRRFYHPANMVLSIVSHLSLAHWKNLLKKTDFLQMNPGKKPKFHSAHLEVRTKPQYIIHLNKDIPNTQLMVGFQIENHYSPHRWKYDLLCHALNGMSGRLFSRLREVHGLTYQAYAETELEEFAGYFSINTEMSPNNLLKTKGILPLILELFEDLVKTGISQEELDIAKGRVRGNHLIESGNVDTFVKHNGQEMLLNQKVVPFQKVFSVYYQKVTLGEMNRLCREMFVPERMIVSIVSPRPPTQKQVEMACKHFIKSI
jgi:predicted Zn-dependent peptidase